jgi:Family of unknown function (DUF5771)
MPKVRIKLKDEGSLTRLGYIEHEPKERRLRALRKAVRRFGYKRTADKLVALQVLNKNRNPEFSHVAREDRLELTREYHHPMALRNR